MPTTFRLVRPRTTSYYDRCALIPLVTPHIALLARLQNPSHPDVIPFFLEVVGAEPLPSLVSLGC